MAVQKYKRGASIHDMLINFIINVFLILLNALFSWLPTVEFLPAIADFDIDTALVEGIGQLRALANDFWFITNIFAGLLFLLGYYALKQVLRFFLGHRAPTN